MSAHSRLAPALRRPQGDEEPGQSTISSSPSKKQRKPHKKSRSGCRTCKKRKIKCDEAEPECTQCKRFGVPCDLLPPSERESRAASYEDQRKQGARRQRGRPRSDWTKLPCSGSHSSSSQGRPISRTVSPDAAASPASGLNVDDLLLFHHYCTVTAATIGHVCIWRDSVPRLGRRFPSVLHAALSISAYHLARVELQDAPHYMRQGEEHYEIVVRNATTMIADLTIKNCQVFYVLAVMICFISFARKPSPGDLMLVSRDGCNSSLHLIRGVRFVLKTFGSSVVFSGFLAPNEIIDDDGERPSPLEEQAMRDKRRRRVEIAFPGWKWQDGLDRLQMQLQKTSESPADQVLRETLASMRRCFESICETLPPTHQRKDADFVSVMRWVYEFDDIFIQFLNGGHRVALVLVGYFGVCLEVLEGFWWLEGWGRHILRELKGMLLDEYEMWLPHAR